MVAGSPVPTSSYFVPWDKSLPRGWVPHNNIKSATRAFFKNLFEKIVRRRIEQSNEMENNRRANWRDLAMPTLDCTPPSLGWAACPGKNGRSVVVIGRWCLKRVFGPLPHVYCLLKRITNVSSKKICFFTVLKLGDRDYLQERTVCENSTSRNNNR